MIILAMRSFFFFIHQKKNEYVACIHQLLLCLHGGFHSSPCLISVMSEPQETDLPVCESHHLGPLACGLPQGSANGRCQKQARGIKRKIRVFIPPYPSLRFPVAPASLRICQSVWLYSHSLSPTAAAPVLSALMWMWFSYHSFPCSLIMKSSFH